MGMATGPSGIQDKDPERERGGEFLAFSIGGGKYGLSITRIEEAIEKRAVTLTRRTPHYVKDLWIWVQNRQRSGVYRMGGD